MKFWQVLSFTETDQLVDLARICEEGGFHGVFVSDHVVFPEKIASRYPYSEDGSPPFGADTEWPEAWAAVSAMATATRRLHFGTAVYLAPLRHPLLVAQSLATASVLSQGRVSLGAGVGWVKEEYDVLGQDFRTRGRRLDEMLEILRKVWGGGMVEHRGEFYAFDRLQMSPSPVGPIPIHVGGASEPALRRAARNDGWIGSGNMPDEIPPLVERLRGYRREYGLEREPFEIVAALPVAPDLDLYRRLEDAGVTGMIHYPLGFRLGPRSPLESKRRVLEQYAEGVISRY